MVQGAAVAVLMTVVNLAVQSAQGVNAIPFALSLLVLGVSAVAGLVGGAVYFATEPWRVRGGWRKTGVNVVTILVACAMAVALLVLAGWAGLLGERVDIAWHLTNVAADKHFSAAASPQLMVVCLQLN